MFFYVKFNTVSCNCNKIIICGGFVLKNKKFKKFYLGAATLALGIGMLLPSTASADQLQLYNNGSHTFKKSWSVPVSTKIYRMTFGYNTSWINEDFTHAFVVDRTHSAVVNNANGTFSTEASKNQYAKIEVRHSGTKILYGISYPE